jgi:hypothetical protein
LVPILTARPALIKLADDAPYINCDEYDDGINQWDDKYDIDGINDIVEARSIQNGNDPVYVSSMVLRINNSRENIMKQIRNSTFAAVSVLCQTNNE